MTWSAASATNATDRLRSLQQAARHLSDGTLVELHYDPASATTLQLSYVTGDRSTRTLIEAVPCAGVSGGEFQTPASAFALNAWDIAVDAHDNIYVVGIDGNGNMAMRAYAKGSGFTWTAQPLASSTRAAATVSALWCATGGGTSNAGHVLAIGSRGATAGKVWQTFDVGAALGGSGVGSGGAILPATLPFTLGPAFGSGGAILPATLPFVLGRGLEVDGGLDHGFMGGAGAAMNGNHALSASTFGAASGLAVGLQSSTSLWVGRWAVGPDGTLSTDFAITTSLAAGSLSATTKVRVVRIAPSSWVIAYRAPSSSKIELALFSASAQVGVPQTWGTIATWSDTAGASYAWDITTDGADSVRLFSWDPGDSTSLRALDVTFVDDLIVNAGISTLAGTLTDGTGGNDSIRFVTEPVNYTFVDWQTFNTGAPQALLGSYVKLAPSIPTVVTPSNGTTVSTDIPVLGMTHAGDALVKGEWEIATDSAFTTELRIVTEPDEDLQASGGTVETLPTPQQLFQGTWYIRGRSISSAGVPSEWAPGHSFLVSHPPEPGQLSPTGGEGVPWNNQHVTLSWQFGDSSEVDFSTAYQIIVERNSDGLQLLDTGKITALVVASYDLLVPTNYKDVQLRWRVRLWDSDDVVGSYSPNQLFLPVELPTVTIVSPLDGRTVTNPTPPVEFVFAGSVGRTLRRYKVQFLSADETVVIYDSDWQFSSVTTWVPTGVPLLNATTYKVRVIVEDSLFLQNTSPLVTFDTDWTAADSPTVVVNVTPYFDSGYVHLSWSNDGIDTAFAGYRLYRRSEGGPWLQLLETRDDLSTYTFDDWLAPANVSSDYVVTQAVLRFGTVVESVKAHIVSVTPQTDSYWLIYPPNLDLSLKLHGVTGDNFQDEEYETAELIVIGRGRHVDFGTSLGVSGSLTVQLRNLPSLTARQQRLGLRTLRRQRESMYLRNPFGDVYRVNAPSIQMERVPGVGNLEFNDATISYSEVA